MAAKKTKSKTKVSASLKGVGGASAKKAVRKATKTAKGLLDKLAQRSAQLIVDSGVLGKAPKKTSKRAPAKKKARKA